MLFSFSEAALNLAYILIPSIPLSLLLVVTSAACWIWICRRRQVEPSSWKPLLPSAFFETWRLPRWWYWKPCKPQEKDRCRLRINSGWLKTLGAQQASSKHLCWVVIKLAVLYPFFPVCVEGKTVLFTSSVAMHHPAKRSPKWRSSFQKCLLSKEWLTDHMKTVCSRAFWEASDSKPVHSEWISQILFNGLLLISKVYCCKAAKLGSTGSLCMLCM